MCVCVCVLYFLSYREGEGIVLAKLKAKMVIVTNNSKNIYISGGN